MNRLGILRKLAISPLPLAPGATLTWLLRRAFGPVGGAAPEPEPREAVALARALGLAGMVCGRLPMAQLEAELGVVGARELAFQHLQVRAANRVLAAALQTVIEVAGREGIQLVLLKQAALARAGVVQEGQRDARDVDVLVSPADADTLWRKLREAGFRPFNVVGGDFHLTPLVLASGACVEIHHHLWGVRLGSDEPATLAALVEAELTAHDASAPHVHVPSRDLLSAHALVHGLAQHMTSPADYAPLRVFSDLFHLKATRADANAIQRLLRGDLDLESVHAALEIAQALEAGSSFSELGAGVSELLAHVLAASTDVRYARALRAHRLLELRQSGGLLQAARRLFQGHKGPAVEDSVAYQDGGLGERAREAWEIALGVVACAQLRKRRASAVTSSTTSGNSSNPVRPSE